LRAGRGARRSAPPALNQPIRDAAAPDQESKGIFRKDKRKAKFRERTRKYRCRSGRQFSRGDENGNYKKLTGLATDRDHFFPIAAAQRLTQHSRDEWSRFVRFGFHFSMSAATACVSTDVFTIL
jgi:hypothetical protein